jgi:hypothetical protein
VNDLVLRVCLRAYPPEVRDPEGQVILDLARDLSSKGGISMIREGAGMLLGGFRVRARALNLDLTTAPWRAALGRLTMPLAMAFVCLMVTFAASVFQPEYMGVGQTGSGSVWIPVWAVLGVLASSALVVGLGLGYRPLAVWASILVLALMSAAVLVEFVVHHTAIWSGNVYNYELPVLLIWTPAAVLLTLSARSTAYSRTRGRRTTSAVVWAAAVIISTLLALTPVFVPTLQLALRPWGESLGGAFIYVPITLVAIRVVSAILQTDPTAETSTVLLVATTGVPVFILVPETLGRMTPGIDKAIWSHPGLWIVYYVPGVVLLCLVMWVLLHHRRVRTARVAHS